MYAAHFGLRDNPFSITPDPGYLYLSPYHQEALAHLVYGTGENGGFVQLTGEVGTGKTTLIRALLEQHLENVDVALCLNPQLTVEELVATICDELHVDYARDNLTLKPLIDALNEHLLKTHAEGRCTVLVIDEAQNLSRPVLEQVRLLTNLETRRHKLLRIILVGQPELQRLLERPDMRQVAQRITARYHLNPLNRRQTEAYILHRLRVAGGHRDLFTPAALRTVHRLSRGIPRLINVVCDRALLGAYSRGFKQVDGRTLRRAAREVLPDRGGVGGYLRLRLIGAILLVGLIGVSGYLAFLRSPPLLPAILARLQTPSLTQPIPPQTASQTTSVGTAPLAEPAESAPSSMPAPLPAAVQGGDPPHASIADVEAWLRNSRNDDQVMARLLSSWGENGVIPAGLAPCEYVKTRQLRCLSGRGDWDELRRYNRPAILNLSGPGGQVRQIVLRTLTGDTAIVDVVGNVVQIDQAALAPVWTGAYLIVWRPPFSVNLIGPGVQGEPVVWVRQRLAPAEGRTPLADPVSPVFDQDLQEQVRNFQRTHQLEADGLVGQRTLALLDGLVPMPDTPQLRPSVAFTGQ